MIFTELAKVTIMKCFDWKAPNLMKQKPGEVKNHSLQESEIKNICSAIIDSVENYQK